MSRIAWLLFVVTVFETQAHAELRWKSTEAVDDISGTKVRTVAVVGEDNKSALVLRAEEGKKLTLTLVPNTVLFPDKTDVESKVMGILITMRSTVMEKPLSGMWRMAWMDYKSASVSCKRDTAVSKVFAGDSVTVQLDKTGKRFKFATKGDGLEGLQEAVSKAVEIAADDAPLAATSTDSK